MEFGLEKCHNAKGIWPAAMHTANEAQSLSKIHLSCRFRIERWVGDVLVALIAATIDYSHTLYFQLMYNFDFCQI